MIDMDLGMRVSTLGYGAASLFQMIRINAESARGNGDLPWASGLLDSENLAG